MHYILIVVALINTHMNHHTQVTMQEFSDVKACRAAADEIARRNNQWGYLRMSCVPKATTQEPSHE